MLKTKETSELFEEFFARVLFLLENNKRLGLVLGPPRSGKTTLLQSLEERMRRRRQPTVLFNAAAEESILPRLWSRLSGDPENRPGENTSREILWRNLTRFLLNEPRTDAVPILIFEDVDQYDQNVIQELIRLIRYHDVNQIPRVFLFSANSEYLFSLDSRLLERIDLKLEVV